MERCCGNCEHFQGFELTCPFGIKSCLEGIGLNSKRGKHLKYYNHFKPKDTDKCSNCSPDYYKPGKTIDAVKRGLYLWCPSCGKSLENYGNKEDKMALIPDGGHSTTAKMMNKPDKVAYKPTGKSLTARQVIAESRLGKYELQKFAKFIITDGYGMDTDMFGVPTFLHYALKHTCFRDFLLAGGYIEKVEETWVSPKVGDKFKYRSTEYTLCQVGALKYCLISNLSANRLKDPVLIRCHDNITKGEFQEMCGKTPVDELERI